PRSPQHVAIVPQTRSRVHQERGRLEPARRCLVLGLERSQPQLDRRLPFARKPARRAGELEHRSALAGVRRLLERAGSLGPALQLEQRQPAPERMVVVCQLLEPAFAEQLPRVVHRPKDADGRGSVQERAAALSLMRHTAAMDRLRQVPWDALRAGVAVPAIASVLEGVPAEREVDRVLRRNRGLSRDERTALVEAVFGVSLWRRRLRWETGACSPAVLLASLLRDLAGVSEARAQALTGAAQAPRRDAAPERLADRWSLPDWLEAHLISELGEAAEAFCAAIAAPGPVCLRANRLLCTRDQLAARLLDEGVETAPTPRAPDGVFVRTSRANLFGTRAWREGLFEPQDEG